MFYIGLKKENYSLLQNISILVVLSIVSFLLLNNYHFDYKLVIVFFSLPFLSLIIFNIRIAILGAICLLFVPISFFYFRVVVFSSLVLIVSFLVTLSSSDKKHQRTKNPLLLPFSIYIITMLPSLYNTIDLFLSLLYMFNLISMIIVASIIGSCISNTKQIRLFSLLFLVVCLVNGAYIIIRHFSIPERFFGFISVVYVDFVCIAIIISLSGVLFHKRYLGILSSALTIFLVISLLFTQTRNNILSLSVTLFIAFLFLLKNCELFNYKRIVLIKRSSFAIATIVICLTILLTAFPELSSRFSESNEIELAVANDFGQSSLITRLLIWHTSILAFLKHPIIGIGAFSFPFSSHLYYAIPVDLYKLFVENLSPHVAYLAVITETGIVGLAGFIFLLFSVIRLNIRCFNMSKSLNQRIYSFTLLFLHVYVVISMGMTDAWLWGQCGMLWSVLIGISLAQYNILSKDVSCE